MPTSALDVGHPQPVGCDSGDRTRSAGRAAAGSAIVVSTGLPR